MPMGLEHLGALVLQHLGLARLVRSFLHEVGNAFHLLVEEGYLSLDRDLRVHHGSLMLLHRS